MSGLALHSCVTSPLLANIQEENVAFVICVSENISSKLIYLKELLIKTLFSLASKSIDSTFSIVSCAGKVLKWQNGLVKYTLTNVTEAAAWIRSLQCNCGAKALHAVLAALEDPTCQAVYLFTSGMLECAAEEIYSHLKETGQERPVHTVYLLGNGEGNKTRSQEILENIAQKTGASYQAISLKLDGASDKVNPRCLANVHHSDCISKPCLPTRLMGDHTTTCIFSGICSNIFLRNLLEDSVDSSSKIANLQRGIRVLARKELDGYYYPGHIVQEVKDSRGHVEVEFERSQRPQKGKAQFCRQETPLYDVIHYEDAKWHPLAAGDRVLALWEKKGDRYGPGTALQVVETESPCPGFKNKEVLVNFWNGQTKKVSADVAVRIPLPLSDRIILELQMPSAARRMLVEQSPNYPCVVPPGYRASGPCRRNCADQIHWHRRTPKVQDMSSPHQPLCHVCFPAWEPIDSPMCTREPGNQWIPGTSSTKEGLSKKTKEQLSAGRLPSCETGSRKLKDIADLKSCEEAESKITKSSKNHQKSSQEPKKNSGTVVDVAVNTDNCLTHQNQKGFVQLSMTESSNTFSQRYPSRKMHVTDNSQLESMFDWVDQSLKKDRLAIETVLRIRRSYSVPSMQKPMKDFRTQKAVPRDGSRDVDDCTARIEFMRRKREQRRLQEEQKQKEGDLKKELLLNNKRQRSLQRSLQDLQKQQESSKRTQQRMEQLQVARTEKIRGKSCLQEEEKTQETQRLDFLKAQRKQREKQLAEHNQRTQDHAKQRLELLRNRTDSTQNNLEAVVQGEVIQKKEKEAAKWKAVQKRHQMSQQAEEKTQKHQALQRYLKEHRLLMLRTSLLS